MLVLPGTVCFNKIICKQKITELRFHTSVSSELATFFFTVVFYDSVLVLMLCEKYVMGWENAIVCF